MALSFKTQIEESSDNYVKLRSGESVTGVLVGDTLEQYKHWIEKKPFICQGAGCEHCASGVQRKFAFKVNFLVRDQSGNLTAKILDKGASVYKQLQGLSDEWDLSKTWLKISRKGEMLDTEYSVVPSPKQLTPQDLKKVSEVELLDLEDKAPQSTGSASSDEDVPF